MAVAGTRLQDTVSVDAKQGRGYSEAMTVSVEYAAEHLKELLAALDAGIPVAIERADKPPVALKSEIVAEESSVQQGKRILGAGRGELRIPSDEEWERMDLEWRASYMHKFEVGDRS